MSATFIHIDTLSTGADLESGITLAGGGIVANQVGIAVLTELKLAQIPAEACRTGATATSESSAVETVAEGVTQSPCVAQLALAESIAVLSAAGSDGRGQIAEVTFAVVTV